jgi:putative redox protein
MSDMNLNVGIKLINDSIKFSCASNNYPPIITDYYPPLGNNEGYTALEVFLASLGSCASGTIIPILKKMRKTIKEYEMKLEGIKKTEHPKAFSKIIMNIRIRSEDVSEADLDRALSLAEDKFCPVWSMIKGNVEIEKHYIIEK